MPPTEPLTGLHTPITNIPPSESSVSETMISEGSIGSQGELNLPAGATKEMIPRLIRESAIEFVPPDISSLVDIGAASFGFPVKFETVLGTDERVQVTETTKFPWCAMASLVITAADNSSWVGTGWFISPRTLITAGHCVYIKNSGITARDGFVKKIQVMPGRNGNTLPFGGLSATEFWTVKGWGENGLENYDYGAIILPATFPQELGFFSYGVFDDNKLLASVANVGGYPADQPKGTLWHDFRDIGSVKPEKVFYAADTAGGQSGAVVYIVHEQKRVGVAIHAYGGVSSNSGTRISSQVFTNLESWKRS